MYRVNEISTDKITDHEITGRDPELSKLRKSVSKGLVRDSELSSQPNKQTTCIDFSYSYYKSSSTWQIEWGKKFCDLNSRAPNNDTTKIVTYNDSKIKSFWLSCITVFWNANC